MELLFHKAGEVVFHYGEPGKHFYIILDGTVSVLVPINISKGKNPDDSSKGIQMEQNFFKKALSKKSKLNVHDN